MGFIILLFWLVCAIGGEHLTPFDPIDDFGVSLQPPSAEHPFGTDQLGRDVLSRVMAGARDVLIAAPIAAGVSVALGR